MATQFPIPTFTSCQLASGGDILPLGNELLIETSIMEIEMSDLLSACVWWRPPQWTMSSVRIFTDNVQAALNRQEKCVIERKSAPGAEVIGAREHLQTRQRLSSLTTDL